MTIQFLDGTTLHVTQINEDKRIYSAPKKWELKLISDEDLTSLELDALLVEENISKLLCVKEDGTSSEILGYSFVDRVSKTKTNDVVSLIIVLQKDIVE